MKHTGPGLSHRMAVRAHYERHGIRSVDSGVSYRWIRAPRHQRQLAGIELINAAHRDNNDDGGPSAA